MGNKNIGLISPSKNAYSETFIQQHRNNIQGNIVFYFNGNLPTESDIDGELMNNIYLLLYKIKKRLKLTKFKPNEQALIRSFKKQKIKLVLAEYGTTGVSVLRVCKFLKLPLIPIFHGYDASVTHLLVNYKKTYLELFEYSERIVVVSNKILKTLVKLGCDKTKIVVTPCAPHNRFFEITPNFDVPLFIGVGRFVDKKAPYYTILAFKKVLEYYPKAKLVLAGNGPLYNTCENLIKYFKIEDNIELPGVITPKKLASYFKIALAFVQHSIVGKNGDSEGTPVAILEASAAGLPVISTLHAGIPDVIIEGKTGFLVPEHDVEKMAEKMMVFLNDLDKAKKMGSEGKLFIRNHFSMDKHIAILNKVIDETLKIS